MTTKILNIHPKIVELFEQNNRQEITLHTQQPATFSTRGVLRQDMTQHGNDGDYSYLLDIGTDNPIFFKLSAVSKVYHDPDRKTEPKLSVYL